jgi:hypothetical protein
VSGTWDFLGVVLALSGFLIAGGPAILSNLTTSLHGAPTAETEGGSTTRQLRLGVLLVLYFALLIVGIGLALRRRRDVTSVYNINPTTFDEVFGEVLDQLGMAWTRAGNRFYLNTQTQLPASLSIPPTSEGAITAEGPGAGADLSPAAVTDESTVIEVDPFPLMHHVTIRWGDLGPKMHQEIEGELARALSHVYTRSNPVSGWFQSAAAMFFLLIAVVLVLLLLANLLFRG